MWLISVFFLRISGATCWWSETLRWMAGCWDASATCLRWRWSEFNVTIFVSSWDGAHQRVNCHMNNHIPLIHNLESVAVQLSCVCIISSVQVCYHPRQCGEDWRQLECFQDAWCLDVADGVIWRFLHLNHSFWRCKDIETLPLCLTEPAVRKHWWQWVEVSVVRFFIYKIFKSSETLSTMSI